jgi:hypothetical protein
MPGIMILTGLFLLGALPHAAAQYFGSVFHAGSTTADQGNAIARDAAGNLYVTGSFTGTADFDDGAGTVNVGSFGDTDIFVAKYTPGGVLIWAKGMGGSGADEGRSIAVDASGNVFTTGFFNGTGDFDPGPATVSLLTSAGNKDIFVSKLDSSGNFVFARSMGGTFSDYGNDIAVDASGNVLTTGGFTGTADFDPGAGTVNLTSGSGFVSKLDSSGNFVWAKEMGGGGAGIATDASGNVFTTGNFFFTQDFDPGAGTFNLTASGSFADIYVSKLDSNGNFVFAKQMGGDSDDLVSDIAVDASGNVLTTGSFVLTADFDPGAGRASLNSRGNSDIFVSKLDNNGNFVFARGIGSTNADVGSGIAVDASGNVFTTGYFDGIVDFDPGAGRFDLHSRLRTDIYVSKLDGSGNFAFAVSMGGTGTDQGKGIVVDSAGNVFTTGLFNGDADFNPGDEPTGRTSAEGNDIFVSWLRPTPITDFLLDGKQDLVWRHDSGVISFWFMDGINLYSTGSPNPKGTDPSWKISGVGDFNQDGDPDLLWRHDGGAIYVWYQEGGSYVTGNFFNPAQVDPSWKISGLGDFNQDGKPDLVWRHDSGAICVWFMDGTQLLMSTFFNPGQTDPSWKISGVGDFNQDGKPDLIWRHDGGAICVWFMDGINILSSSFFNPAQTDPSWRIIVVGDFNQDTKQDLVWRHDSGALYAWFMDGINLVSGSFFNPGQLDPSWKSPGP